MKEAENVDISADEKIDKFEAAKAKKLKKGAKPGATFVPGVHVMWGEYPTLSSFYESRRESREEQPDEE